MQKTLFQEKANEMGDFYMYYTATIGGVGPKVTFGVCTADLDNPYIKSHPAPKHVPSNKVLVWNWKANRYLVVNYDAIKKLVPLATVLKNAR